MDSISDIFKTMHVTAFGLHRLEATSSVGFEFKQQESDEKATRSSAAETFHRQT